MAFINNIFYSFFGIERKAESKKIKLILTKNEICYSILDFKNSLIYGKVEEDYSLFDIFSYITLQKNYLNEFKETSKELSRSLEFDLKSKNIHLFINLEFVDDGIIILKFPSKSESFNTKEFRLILLDNLRKFYIAYSQRINGQYNSQLEEAKEQIFNFIYEHYKNKNI